MPQELTRGKGVGIMSEESENLTSRLREVREANLDGACKAESLNRCYTFFLQEKIAEGDSMTQRKSFFSSNTKCLIIIYFKAENFYSKRFIINDVYINL